MPGKMTRWLVKLWIGGLICLGSPCLWATDQPPDAAEVPVTAEVPDASEVPDAAEDSDTPSTPDAAADTEEVAAEADDPLQVSATAVADLPASFAALRPIYFFQGQASGLVPDSFRPITVSQLDSRLRADRGMSLSAFEKPQLIRAVYVARLIDAALVSTQSSWDIAYAGDVPTRLVLGKLGVALQSTTSGGGSGLPFSSEAFPVITDPEGNVSVAVEGDTKLTLAWTAAGQESDREVLFDLAIPKAGQTRWLIEVPQGLQVEALDGVGRPLPSPPPEAGTRDLDRAASWFAIDAGGLSRLRLRVLKVAPDSPAAPVAVRQASVQYELAPASLRFTARLVIDPLADRALPPIQISSGRITSVSVDGSSAYWTETSTGDGRMVRIDSSRLDVAGAANITIDGEAPWGGRPGAQKLPWLQLRECVPILIGNEMQAKVLIDSRLSVPRLELPPTWRFTAPLEADERRTTYRLGGPWVSEGPAVRAVPDAGQLFAESLLRLSATETRLRGVSEISIDMAALGPQPIRLRMEPGWTPEVVLLPQSGRAVDLPHDVAARRNIVIWPTADELKDGNLMIRIVGSQPLPTGDFARYPTTSFLSIANCRHRSAAVVTPPPGFRWTADASLRTQRIAADQLSAQQREMLGELPAEALLLDISHAKIPPLGSRRPAAAFSASSLMRLALANNRLVETYYVKCESASGELNQIRIEFAAGNRPDLEWSILDKENPTRRLIRSRRLVSIQGGASPGSLVTNEPPEELDSELSESVEPREIWELELERADARSVILVGRREYPITLQAGRAGDAAAGSAADSLRVDLPSVTGASTRLAQVLVEPSLDVHRCGEGVLRVPQLVGGDEIMGDSRAFDSRGTALRYDSTAATWIELRGADAAAPVPVLWQESVQVVASRRGGDWITATYSADAEATLVIDHEPGLRLAEVTDQQAARLDYDASPSRLVVKALPTSTQVIVQWARPAVSDTLWGHWTPPRISTAGVMLRRDWQLVAASDTLIPASLVSALRRSDTQPLPVSRRWLAQDAAHRPADSATGMLSLRLDPDARQSLWLVDRSIGLSLVAVVGTVLFGLAWWIALGSPLVVGIGFIVSVLLLAGLPAGWFYWIAGVCVPLAAGALVGTTLSAWRLEDRLRKPGGSSEYSAGRRSERGSRPPAGQRDISQTVDGIRDPSSRSLLGKLGGGLIISLSWSLSLPTLAAEESAVPTPPPRPTVLIPAKTDGSPAGDKVYISQSFFNELFRDKSASAAAPLITSAAYRMRLDGMAESAMPSAEWEIRYSLAEVGERAEILLPIRPAQLRSVQWLSEGEAKPLRWSAEEDAEIRVALPPGPAAALLLRLVSDVEMPEQSVRRIRLPIPAVASASLVVDSSSAVQRFELAGALGQTIAQPEAGRLSAALGAVNAIDLTVSLRQGSRAIPAIAARRYWVHASESRCQIECEVDPSEETVRRGSDVPIVILGGPPPILTSADWSIHGAEMISPRRQLLTLRALRDGAEPIRLLWEMESEVSSANNEDEAAAVVIPDVISAGSAQTPEALIALHAIEGLQLVPQAAALATASDSADAVDAFVASWKGYRGTAQQVIRSPSPLVRLVVQQPPTKRWKSDEIHHLHVRPGETRLTYQASITRGQRTLGPLRVTLPPGSDVRELMVNGESIASAPQRIGNRSEIALPEPPGSEKIRLRIVTHQRLPSTEPFQPPRIRIEPIRQVSGSYSITRNQLLRVEQVTGTGLPEIETPPLDIADQLLSGWIPCWTWAIDEDPPDSVASSDRSTELPGAFRIAPQSTSLDVLQQTTVRWRQSRWMMDAVIRVQARSPEGDELPLLDDVNVELPRAWSDQLLVEPAEAWSSQPAIDPAMRVVRIRPDAASRAAGVATIRIQGMRIGDSDSLLEVPKLQLLAAATRRAYFVVPQSIGGRSLVWKALSAAADQLPDAIAGQSGNSADSRPDEKHPLVFRALTNAATVRLEPSRSQTTVARATVADIQLFPQQQDQWLAIIRWDLEPGDRDQVSIRVPPGATPIAVWTAGKPFPLKRRSEAQDRPAGTSPPAHAAHAADSVSSTVDVTLSLSRLAQPLVMLCQLRVAPSGSQPELPQLVDTDVEQTWLSLYEPTRELAAELKPRMAYDDSGWLAARPQDRLVVLAQSVLKVTESSISGATDRPQEELLAWLKSWDERLAKLQSESRRWSSDEEPPRTDEEASAEPEDGEPDDRTEEDGDDEDELAGTPGPWESLGRHWRQYTRRVTGGKASPGGDTSPAVMPAAHWQVAFVAHHPGAADRLPMLTVQSDSSRVALAINLLIGLVIVLGCALLALRCRALLTPLSAHPAFWLFAVGFVSLAVAPTPVALAILLVAVSGPLLVGRSGPTPSAARIPRRPIAR